MAGSTFADTPDAVLLDPTTQAPTVGAHCTVWTADPTSGAGTQITALTDLAGTPLTETYVSSDTDGRIPFKTVDTYRNVWVQDPSGNVYRFRSKEAYDDTDDFLDQFPSIQSAATQASSDAAEAKTTATNANTTATGAATNANNALSQLTTLTPKVQLPVTPSAFGSAYDPALTDQYSVLQQQVDDAPPGLTVELPAGAIGLSQPLVITNGARLRGRGQATNNTNYGTLFAPTAAWTDPVVATATGGNIAAGDTYSQTINDASVSVQLYTYSGGSGVTGMVAGQKLSLSGSGTASLPADARIISISGSTATIAARNNAITPGTVGTLQAHWGALVVVNGNNGGLRDLGLNAGDTASSNPIAWGVLGVGNDAFLENVAAIGGTAASVGIFGTRWRCTNLRARLANQSLVFKPVIGPFSLLATGVDHKFMGLYSGTGTTALGNGIGAFTGMLYNAALGTGTNGDGSGNNSGGPALQVCDQSGGAMFLSGLQINDTAGTEGVTALVQHIGWNGGQPGSPVIQNVSINAPVHGGMPIFLDDVAGANPGKMRVSHVTLLSGFGQYSYLVRQPNGGSRRLIVSDVRSEFTSATAPTSGWTDGANAQLRDVWAGATEIYDGAGNVVTS